MNESWQLFLHEVLHKNSCQLPLSWKLNVDRFTCNGHLDLPVAEHGTTLTMGDFFCAQLCKASGIHTVESFICSTVCRALQILMLLVTEFTGDVWLFGRWKMNPSVKGSSGVSLIFFCILIFPLIASIHLFVF